MTESRFVITVARQEGSGGSHIPVMVLHSTQAVTTPIETGKALVS